MPPKPKLPKASAHIGRKRIGSIADETASKRTRRSQRLTAGSTQNEEPKEQEEEEDENEDKLVGVTKEGGESAKAVKVAGRGRKVAGRGRKARYVFVI